MEVQLKKTTASAIFEHEVKVRDNIYTLFDDYSARFSKLGYTLSMSFERSSEDEDFMPDELTAPASHYANGYNCRVTFLVKRPKNQEELAEDEETARRVSAQVSEQDRAPFGRPIIHGEEAPETTPEAEEECVSESEEIVDENGNDQTMKCIAFTQLLITRIYRVFWSDKCIMNDDITQIQDDLSEFLSTIVGNRFSEGLNN